MNNTGSNAPSCGPSPRALAVLLLRLALGSCFLYAGLSKFGLGGGPGYTATVASLSKTFNDPLLAGFPSSAFAHALPFLEAVLGALLLIGLRTRCALMLTGLTLLGFRSGLMVLHKPEMLPAQTMIYVLVLLDVAALALLESGNPLSVDACRGSCSSAPKP